MERMKTFLLIGLFLSAVVLSGFVFVDIQVLQDFLFVSPVEEDNANVNISEFLAPQSFQVSFGGGLYSVLYKPEDVVPFWHEYSKLLKDYLQDEQAQIKEISIEQRNSIGELESAKVVLPFTMDIQQLQLMLGLDINLISSISFDEVVIMSNDTYPVYFLDSKERKGYQLISTMIDQTEYKNIFDTIFAKGLDQSVKNDVIDYKRIESTFNLRNSLKMQDSETFIENGILFPEEVVTNLQSVELTQNQSPVEISQSQKFTRIKDDIFGQQSNFVKTVRDDLGSIIYIYGYNEKALMISADGSITYQEHITSDTNKSSTEFKSILQKATRLVTKYDFTPNSLYISDYKSFDNDGMINQIVAFDYKINGITVLVDAKDEKHAIEVEFINGNIARFSVNYRDIFNRNNLAQALSPRLLHEVMNSSDVFKQMMEDYGLAEGDTPYALLQSINGLQLVYYPKPTDTGLTLYPVWQVSVEDRKYLFDFLGVQID